MDSKKFGSKLKELASSPLLDYIKNLFVPPKSIKEYYSKTKLDKRIVDRKLELFEKHLDIMN